MEKAIVRSLQVTGIRELIIIGALDGRGDREPVSSTLSVISHYVDKIPRVKFFIASHPELLVRSSFRLESLRPITEVLEFYGVERSSVDNDTKVFSGPDWLLLPKFESNCDLLEDWLSLSDIDVLCRAFH